MTGLCRPINYGQRHPIFHTSSRILALDFHKNPGMITRNDSLQLNEGSAADGFEDACIDNLIVDIHL